MIVVVKKTYSTLMKLNTINAKRSPIKVKLNQNVFFFFLCFRRSYLIVQKNKSIQSNITN